MDVRDLDARPYSADEQRVADFIFERGFGGGDDPIGFILASYDLLTHAVLTEHRGSAASLSKQGD